MCAGKTVAEIDIGDCYKAAFECVQVYGQAKKDGADPSLADAKIFLVHGSVITHAESLTGMRIDHAWIEVEWPGKCMVFEFANKKQEAKEKSEWVRELCAEEEKRYAPEEASKEAHRVSPPHYGPWHREPRKPI